MKKILSTIILSIGMLTTSISAEDLTYTDFEKMIEDVDTLGVVVVKQQESVSKLSDDIGLMADRIGVMADRIVHTEELMAQTLITLGGSESNGVALVSPLDGDNLSSVPTIETLPSSTSYLLYASSEPTFSPENTLSIFVNSTSTLSSKWSQVTDFCATSCYIAVKRIDDSTKTISAISNSVKGSF